jgi:drug/metabolite transporter (DMT)-like permease
MRPSYLILMITMNCLWAATLSIYKPLGDYLAPGGIVTLRFGVAALLLGVLWPWLPGKAPRGWDLLKTAVMGCVVFAFGQRLQVLGNKLSTASDTSVLMAVEPLVASVAAAIFLREHIGPRRWLGSAIAMVGVALLNEFRWAGLAASLIFMASFLSETAYSIIGKPLIERASVLKILTLALLFGTFANLLMDGSQTFAAVRAMPLRLWWLIAYLSVICTAVGYAFWYVVIRETDVNVTALTIFAQPVAGVAIAALWLREPFHRGQFWGCLVIVAGLVLALSRQVRSAGTALQTRATPGQTSG